MYVRANQDTRFHIDLEWWSNEHRNFRRFLSEILDDSEADLAGGEPMDFIDGATAEVYALDPLWVRVLTERANRDDYITPTTPLAAAVLRALLENLNRPMTVVQLHRRINRSNPDTLLKLMRTARAQYGIVPVVEG